MSSDRGTTQIAGTGAGTFSAADLKRRMAERAAAEGRRGVAAHARAGRKTESGDGGVSQAAGSDEQLMQLIMRLVTQAAESGQSEIQIYRFPNSLCTDGGRRINNSLPDWEKTLEGRPKLGYEFWHDHLRPLGFGLKAEVLEYPGGMPGDIGFFLTWK